MNWKVVLLTLLVGFSGVYDASAQRRKKKDEPAAETTTTPATPAATSTPTAPSLDPYAVQEQVFEQSLKYNDGDVAVQALYNMMALHPQEETLKDTLAYLYFNLNRYSSCLFVARDIVDVRPNNLEMVEIKAISEKNLGLLAEAVSSYEKLYMNTENVYHLYELATLQFQLKRYNEARNSLAMLEKHKDAATQQVTLSAGQRQQSQQVPILAAVYNLQGVLNQETGNDAEAKAKYQKALELFPDFALAKGNLAAMNQPAQK
ncbi:Tetratricopeptide repeat-containing protein [Catalinimonas alkaloidigena]|uniref:Tetratricopeptide repeat-containing protein n=1 Tax=Catalinimonas alkaloidigena TaxID=1075417 RepID=A0A1G8WQA9_9BACT|nr:tetratricopeptide repeat protein [Catalinimonas alkaloidigena]SDJ80227.1 Tetratricopeptide repeat-containing protein [Catalinimonas alkaloidigena]